MSTPSRPDPIDPNGEAAAETIAFPMSEKGTKKPEVNYYNVQPGTILAGKYRVSKVIGHGGMGVVLSARHLQLHIPVAMKLLGPEHASSTEAVARFFREARAASKLQNHHITRVLDVGTLDSGEPYIVMEYLAGEDLSQYIKTHDVPMVDIVDFIAQACEAIGEAHAAGIIHRDIKPANLFVTERTGGGQPFIKVLDFGVSHIDELDGEPRLTKTTTVLGSACYMSPEAMRSAKGVDARTDIYALGCCLYELLAGRPPHVADTFQELCNKVYSTDPTPLRELAPAVPSGLAKVVDRALARDPAARYANIAELLQALSPFGTERTRAAMKAFLAAQTPALELLPRARMKGLEDERRSRGGYWVLLGVVLIGSIVAIIASRRPRTEAAPAPAPVSAAPLDPSPSQVAPPPPSIAPSAPPAPTAAPTVVASASAAPIVSARPKAGPRAPKTNDAPAVPTRSGIDPKINPDLSQEKCFATMPDGTRKQVACP